MNFRCGEYETLFTFTDGQALRKADFRGLVEQTLIRAIFSPGYDAR